MQLWLPPQKILTKSAHSKTYTFFSDLHPPRYWNSKSYFLFKCDVRHRLHCLDLTDTNLHNFTKLKAYLVNQRWRHTTCLQHPCYDVGCYPWNNKKNKQGIKDRSKPEMVSWVRCGTWLYGFLIFAIFLTLMCDLHKGKIYGRARPTVIIIDFIACCYITPRRGVIFRNAF